MIHDIKYSNKINNILQDNVEIERKRLINVEDIPYDLTKAKKIAIERLI